MSTSRSSTSRLCVTSIGSATRDIFISSPIFESRPNHNAPDGSDACFPLGAKIGLKSCVMETGGGATNAAVTFARFGFKTSCIARLGNDQDGYEIAEVLRREKVDVGHLQLDREEHTGVSIILLDGIGHRSILTYRGAANNLDFRAMPWTAKAPDWIYLTSLGGNLDILEKIFRAAQKHNIRLAWNPGNAELALGMRKLRAELVATDFLLLNREEAAELAEVAPRHLDSAIKRLSPFPRQALAITDGEGGAYVSGHGTVWHAPAIPGKRVNTTGAGDAFGSGFVAAAITSGNIETGLRAGMLNAHGVITHMGAKAGILIRMPSANEMRRVKVTKTIL